MQKIRIAMATFLLVVVMVTQTFAAAEPEKIVLEKNYSTYLDLWGLDSVAVANPEIADITVVSNREILIVAKAQGSTSLQVKFKSGNRTTYTIVVTDGDKAVAVSIENMINYPNVKISKVGENIVLDGHVEDQIEKKRAETIAKMFGKNIVNLLELENPKQIKIEAKIVEIDSDKVDKIGLQYFNASEVKYDKDTGISVTPGTTGTYLMGQNLGKGAYGWFGDYAGINANLSLLITNGHARVLSQPNVMTMSGEKAYILIGGEIPVPISSKDGQVSVDWREYGIKLDIEPNVGIEDQITGKIVAEVSSLDYNAAVALNTNSRSMIPALRSRKAETVITLKSGHTMAVGGLINSDESKQVMKVPLLGDIPIIGEFFKHTSKNKERKEIIILITPTLVDSNYKTPMSHKMKSFLKEKADEEKKLAKSPEQLAEDAKLEKEAEERKVVKAKAEEEKKIQAAKRAEQKQKDLAEQQAIKQAEKEKLQKEQEKAAAEQVKKEKVAAEKLAKEQSREKTELEKMQQEKKKINAEKAKQEAEKVKKVEKVAKDQVKNESNDKKVEAKADKIVVKTEKSKEVSKEAKR